MRKVSILLAALIVALACGSAMAVTTVWLSTSASGTAIPGDAITLAPGGSIQLYCFMSTDAPGNTFEMMVGFDKSNAASWGPGVIGDAATSKLILMSDKASIKSTINAGFNVIRSTAYSDAAVVLNATGRENPNSSIGGMPFGFIVREAKTTNAAPLGNVQCFSFTLKNNMPAGQSQSVVLSNLAGAASYSTAWKYGTSLAEDAYVLTVTSEDSTPLPTVGTSGKNVVNSGIMSTAASKYNWVLWGKVSARDANGFKIDDGSGVLVQVVAAGNTVANGDYVSVRGSLNVTTTPPILTASDVKKY